MHFFSLFASGFPSPPSNLNHLSFFQFISNIFISLVLYFHCRSCTFNLSSLISPYYICFPPLERNIQPFNWAPSNGPKRFFFCPFRTMSRCINHCAGILKMKKIRNKNEKCSRPQK